MFRTLRERIRLERLRQLWNQCDLFDVVERDRNDSPGRQDRIGNGGAAHPSGPTLAIASPRSPPDTVAARPPRRRVRREDAELVQRLNAAHADYNAELFGGALNEIPIRISRRMKHRLGHYMAAGNGDLAEIAMSRMHIATDDWAEVLHTLIHEMVHQWQDENGHPLDHGQTFRRKAREVGISARATRPATSSSPARLAARGMHRSRA